MQKEKTLSENKNTLGLYIHIPFCKSRCIYCDFVSSVSDNACMDKYCDYLKKQIALAKDKYKDKYIVDTIYFGGGTPSILSCDNLLKIANSIKSSFVFDLKEFSIEANPCTIDETKLSTFRQMGVNRISIGVQSFNDDILQMLGRAHDSITAINAIKMAKEYGFEVSVDCMTGLPDQTKEDIEDFVEKATNLNVDHISVYMLSIEEGTKLEELINQGKLTAKSDDEIIELYDTACEFLKEKGFERYEISNFAKNSKVSFHNLRYWRREDYLGLGISAHSLIMNKRWHNPDNFEDYYKALDKGLMPMEDIENLDEEEIKEEYIMLALRLKEGIDIEKYNKKFNSDFKNEYRLALIKDARYLNISDKKVSIKDEYLETMNSIIVDFLK